MKSLRIVPIALVVILVAVTNWAAPPTFAASYVVDTADDDPTPTLTACTGVAGDCSLRGALSNANAAASPGDVITFDSGVFPSGTPTSIVMTVQMTLTTIGGGGDTIDGTGAGVILDGGPESPVINCLQVTSAGNTVRNLQFTDCVLGINLNNAASDNNVLGPGNVIYDNGIGIQISGPLLTGNVVKGNFIGTTADGTAVNGDGGNSAVGIFINSPSNTIGGVNPSDRNVISGNIGTGVQIQDNAINNDVFGNYIGTDVTGTVDLGNGTGLTLQAAGFTDVGGTLPGQPNLISGNGAGGNINLFSGSYNNKIVNNTVGPDVTGSGAAMTNVDGISIAGGSSNNEITGNLISDGRHGVVIVNSTTTGNVVKGNFIGTGPGGSGSVPNSNLGIYLDADAHDNTLGGILPGEGNVVANNGSAGVYVQGTGTTGNSIRGNSIHDNGGSEILLLAGGNSGLAAPTITAAGFGAAGGTACANCTVDVFSDGVADAEFYEGSTVADGTGTFLLVAPIAGPMATATATDAVGNTSQLSVAIAFGVDTDGDGVPDSIDNCPSTSNANQSDVDGDGEGDICDANADNDGLPNTGDPCPTLAEDYDGYQDSDGCPEPDNDLDGVCDAGQVSVSCTGSDSGKQVWDPAGTLPAPILDCRNTAEDLDAFKDGDGCPEPDNDNDGFPDATDDCPGTDSRAGADGMLGAPQDLNHNGVQNGAESALTTDDVMPALVWEDSDGVLDTDGCHDSPGDDFDGDGFTDDDEVFTHLTDAGNPDTDADTVVDGTDNCPNWPNAAQTLPTWTIPALDSDCDGFNKTREQHVGTDPTKHCNATPAVNDEAVDFWPTDFNDSQLTSLADVALMSPAYNKFDGQAGYNKRFDLNASNGVTLADVALMSPFYNKGCG